MAPIVRTCLGCVLVAVWTAAVPLSSFAEGSLRVVDENAVRQDLRVRQDDLETRQPYYPRDVTGTATPETTPSTGDSQSTDEAGGRAGFGRHGTTTRSDVGQPGGALRRNTTPSGLRIVDLPYAPETLNGVGASGGTMREGATGSRGSLATIGSSPARPRHGVRSAFHDSSSRYHSEGLRHQTVSTEMRGPATTSSINHAQAGHVLPGIPGATGLRGGEAAATVDPLKAGLDGNTLGGSSGLNEMRNSLRQESMQPTSDLRHSTPARQWEQGPLRPAVRSGAARSGVGSLKASARINRSASARDTAVVLTVENVGRAAVETPIIRLALPAGSEYKGIAYGPAGTTASVVATGEGDAVDVVVPTRVPSGHSRRVMLYLAPQRGVPMGDLNVEAIPQRAYVAPSSSGTVNRATTQVVPTGNAKGKSKEPESTRAGG